MIRRVFWNVNSGISITLAAMIFTTSWDVGRKDDLYARRTHQPFFHLWGHSWKIEWYGMRGQFEKFLKFVQKHGNVPYTTNSAPLSLL